MKHLTKVTLKALAILAIVAGSIAVDPGWWAVIGFFAIILIVIIGLVVDHFIDKGKWPPFGGPWPRRRRDDKEAVPQLNKGDNEETEEGTKPQAR